MVARRAGGLIKGNVNHMPEELQSGLGLVESPNRPDMPSYEPSLGAVELPESYIIPAFRHWFDASFNVIPSKVFTTADGKEFNHDQGRVDACVGFGGAIVKTSHEGVAASARDLWNLTKRIDAERGLPLDAYGATLWAMLDALEGGVAEDATVPSAPNGMSRANYLDMGSYLNDKVLAERKRHVGGKKAYFVTRDKMRETMFQTGKAVATHCTWFSGDNGIAEEMKMPVGNNVGGHCFADIGWIKGRDVMTNSWGKRWGFHGLFFVPLKDVYSRLGYGYVHVDASDPLPALLAKYNGKDLRRVGTNELYRCELGVLRKYPDEVTWWAFGKLFGFDTFDIVKEDFELIPKGVPMDVKDAPLKTRELVRQVRQHYGKL